jgi:hypothetical protein
MFITPYQIKTRTTDKIKQKEPAQEKYFQRCSCLEGILSLLVYHSVHETRIYTYGNYITGDNNNNNAACKQRTDVEV